MKAVIVRASTPFYQAEFGELDEPVPVEGEVIVEIVASDVNFADILYIEGKYQNMPLMPFAPGLAGAGRICAVASGVTGLTVGQRVLVLPYNGSYAEKVRAPADFCFPIPNDISFETAAALGLAYQTAYFALVHRGGMQRGDRVLVLGSSGGVGMAAIQIAKALGARTVLAATRGTGGAAFARSLGADVTIDLWCQTLRDAVLEATDGHGADVVVDPVGGDSLSAAMRAMAWCGRLVVVGFASGQIPKIGANYLLVKNISASGLQWTDYRARQPERVRAAQQMLFELYSQGKLAPRIMKTMPMSQFATALGTLSKGKARGKLLLLTGHQGE